MNAKKYLVEFRVQGSFTFPVDMLRYDQCFPRTTDDAITMIENERDLGDSFCKPREIELVKYTDQRTEDLAVTKGRWLSFGWRVMNVRISKL